MAPMVIGSAIPASSLSRLSRAIWCGSRSRGSPCGSQPSPLSAARRTAAGEDPPTQSGTRAWAGRGGFQCVDRLVEDGSPPREVDPEGLELLRYVPGADPEDQPAAGEMVERRVLLGGDEGVTEPDDGDMAEEPYALGHSRQEGERGDGVVPDGTHRRGEAPRDGDVVAAREVVEAGAVGDSGDFGEVVRAGCGLPGLGVDRALRLDRELHSIDELRILRHG
jgi:hypothetical protein